MFENERINQCHAEEIKMRINDLQAVAELVMSSKA